MHDIDEIRRKAMGVLEKEAGGPVAAAKQAGMSHSQWANLRSGAPDSKTGKARGMRKETARKIEAAFAKPEVGSTWQTSSTRTSPMMTTASPWWRKRGASQMKRAAPYRSLGPMPRSPRTKRNSARHRFTAPDF